MIEKGNTPAEYVDLLLGDLGRPRRNNGEAVRAAAREWLVNGGDQSSIASRHGVEQHSLSRLIGKLREKDQFVASASKYHV